MQRLFAVELLFVVILMLINGGKSLNCFVCRSDDDEGCSNDVSMSYSVTCPDKANVSAMYCRKISQKLKFKNEGGYTSIRECAYERDPRPCYFFKWLDIAYQETCECDSDLCNRGYTFIPNIRIFTVTFFVWILIYLTER